VSRRELTNPLRSDAATDRRYTGNRRGARMG
jgi:hypothetical protein